MLHAAPFKATAGIPELIEDAFAFIHESEEEQVIVPLSPRFRFVITSGDVQIERRVLERRVRNQLRNYHEAEDRRIAQRRKAS